MIIKYLDDYSGYAAQIFIDDDEVLQPPAAEVNVIWVHDPKTGKDVTRVTWKFHEGQYFVAPGRARKYAEAIEKAAELADEIQKDYDSSNPTPPTQLLNYRDSPPTLPRREEN